MKQSRTHLLVPVDVNTTVAGARDVLDTLTTEIAANDLQDEVRIVETGSFGPVDAGVVVAVQPDGVLYGRVDKEAAQQIVREHLLKGRRCEDYVLEEEFSVPEEAAMPRTERVVLDNCGRINPDSIEEYISADGYFGLAKALDSMTAEQVLTTVKDSGLRGRGGAGFPTGMKWGFCAQAEGGPKVVICNADEGEPGTFKDRLIMEGDPHKVVEGMAVCAYAIGASLGYIYIRGEYALSIQRIRTAIESARRYGLLGTNIMDSGFDFDIEIKIGAGAYVCGEETALINSMEGKPGLPRMKPPFPATAGYLGLPTNVNNVETLANLPAILRHGADWFRTLGADKTPGTKVYTILGHIRHSGLIEVPSGITLREVIERYGNGMRPGSTFKMAHLGGTAGDILGEEMLDVPLDYDALANVGHVLGSGAILVMDTSVPVADLLYSSMKFFVHESCGRCTPCRLGCRQLLDITARLRERQAYPGDLELMEELCTSIGLSAFCPLGQSVANPLLSALRYFRPELEAAVDRTLTRPEPRRNNMELMAFSS